MPSWTCTEAHVIDSRDAILKIRPWEKEMKEYGPETFGKLNAVDYDELHDPGTTGAAVELLAELAKGARTLELAIGTGRLALPLAERGIAIEGLDASPEMVARLRGKPGGDTIPVTIGDMVDVAVDGTFDFVFLAFNTLFNLTTQNDQVHCFRNVARHLNPGGAFLVEAFVPDTSRFGQGEFVRPVGIDFHSVNFEAGIHDPVNQTVHYQYIRVTQEGVRLKPLPMRYAWPSEIDLMAQLAGLDLENRWGGWDRSAFTAMSDMHISLYRRPI